MRSIAKLSRSPLCRAPVGVSLVSNKRNVNTFLFGARNKIGLYESQIVYNCDFVRETLLSTLLGRVGTSLKGVS